MGRVALFRDMSASRHSNRADASSAIRACGCLIDYESERISSLKGALIVELRFEPLFFPSALILG